MNMKSTNSMALLVFFLILGAGAVLTYAAAGISEAAESWVGQGCGLEAG